MSKRKAITGISKVVKKAKPLPINKFAHHKLWLIKSDPPYDIQWVKRTTSVVWEGVRNAEARNMIRDCFKIGQKCLFYMSGIKNPGIHGVVEIVKEAYEDASAHDPNSEYFAKKHLSTPWLSFDVKLLHIFDKPLSLSACRELAVHSISELSQTDPQVTDGKCIVLDGVSNDVISLLEPVDISQNHKGKEDTNEDGDISKHLDSVVRLDSKPSLVVDLTDDVDESCENICDKRKSSDISETTPIVSHTNTVNSNNVRYYVDTGVEAPLKNMVLLHRNRLSISPITPDEFNAVLVAAELQPHNV